MKKLKKSVDFESSQTKFQVEKISKCVLQIDSCYSIYTKIFFLVNRSRGNPRNVYLELWGSLVRATRTVLMYKGLVLCVENVVYVNVKYLITSRNIWVQSVGQASITKQKAVIMHVSSSSCNEYSIMISDHLSHQL